MAANSRACAGVYSQSCKAHGEAALQSGGGFASVSFGRLAVLFWAISCDFGHNEMSFPGCVSFFMMDLRPYHMVVR